jgi:putative phosphoribosyl transferase
MDPPTASPFSDRAEAGRVLGSVVAEQLRRHGVTGRPLVLGLPRGGVVVAAAVAGVVDGDLDIVVSRKIGFPGEPEYGIGAVAERGPPIFSREVLREAGLSERQLGSEVERERAEVKRRVARYRGDRPGPAVTDRVVVLVDDGLATGVTARAALADLRGRRPDYLMFAAPVCARGSMETLTEADAVVCVRAEPDFGSVGAWYLDFGQVSDEDVIDTVSQAWSRT